METVRPVLIILCIVLWVIVVLLGIALYCVKVYFFQKDIQSVHVSRIAILNRHYNNICPICHDTFEVGEKIFRTICKHAFHKECLTEWFKYKITCPICQNHLNEAHLPIVID